MAPAPAPAASSAVSVAALSGVTVMTVLVIALEPSELTTEIDVGGVSEKEAAGLPVAVPTALAMAAKAELVELRPASSVCASAEV